jgi:DNA (cytosine-5)-methyltransferase 1
VADTGPTVLCLFSGVGMLSEAVKLVFPQGRVAAYCEWEAYAAAVLMARMADSSLEPAPIWCGDLSGFDGTQFHGVVDILCAGPPCQPYSAAGKQQGTKDARSFGEDGNGPLHQLARIIGEVQPAMVFLENVPPWIRSGWFREFGERLCGMGYEITQPLFLRASDVGASHKRERVFILAVREGRGLGDVGDTQSSNGRGEQQLGEPGENGRAGSSGTGGAMVESGSERLERQLPGRAAAQTTLGTNESDVEHALCGQQGRRDGAEQGTQEPVNRFGCGEVFAPGPGDRSLWSRIITDTPALAPATQPGVRLFLDGVAYVVDDQRADKLRCAGNGVVALQAAVALGCLYERARITSTVMT